MTCVRSSNNTHNKEFKCLGGTRTDRLRKNIEKYISDNKLIDINKLYPMENQQ